MKETRHLRTTTEFPCGETILQVRTMTDREMKNEGWERMHWESLNPICLVLSDSSIIYPSQDPEGNGPGMFFGIVNGENIALSLSENQD